MKWPHRLLGIAACIGSATAMAQAWHSTPEQADAFAQAERQRWVPFVRAMRIEDN